MRPQSSGSSTVKPVPPQAWANNAKLMGCKSHPYSGLPRNTICSHLICPSELFLMTKTFTGSLYFTHVANSSITDKRKGLPVRICDLRSDGVWQTRRHRC